MTFIGVFCVLSLLLLSSSVFARGYPSARDYAALIDMQEKSVLPWPLASGKKTMIFYSQ